METRDKYEVGTVIENPLVSDIPFEFELLGSRIIYRDLNHYPPEQSPRVWSRYFVPIADRAILVDRTR